MRYAAATLLSKNEARRIAGNFAKLPELVRKPYPDLRRKDPGGLSNVAGVQALPKGRKSMALSSISDSQGQAENF